MIETVIKLALCLVISMIYDGKSEEEGLRKVKSILMAYIVSVAVCFIVSEIFSNITISNLYEYTTAMSQRTSEVLSSP